MQFFSHPRYAESPQKGPMQKDFTIAAELVSSLEREYAAALAKAAVYVAQGPRSTDPLSKAKHQATAAGLKSVAASLDQALQAARAKLPASCHKPENN